MKIHSKSLNQMKHLKIKQMIRKISQKIKSPMKNNRKRKNRMPIKRKNPNQNRIRLNLTVNQNSRENDRIPKTKIQNRRLMFRRNRRNLLTKRKSLNSESKHRLRQGVNFPSKSRKPNSSLSSTLISPTAKLSRLPEALQTQRTRSRPPRTQQRPFTRQKRLLKSQLKQQSERKRQKKPQRKPHRQRQNVGKAVVEASKATAAAVKELGAAIAAGGAPVVIIIIICLLIAVAGTCFGIFLSNDKTTGSQMTMAQAISQLTTDYYTDLESFKSNYDYDQYEIKTGSGNITIDWKTVLAVYAVKTTTSTEDAYEVVTMDDTKYELLKTVLYDMNPKSGEVTQKSVPIITVETDENGVSVKKTTYETKKVLTITIGHLSADEICEFYNFNAEQKQMLNELLSDEYADLWNEIVNSSGAIIYPGGTQIGTGGFVWPVAGPYSITSRFGTRVDPISGVVKTHGGTDIAAAQGTPIVAAADGTVVISSYMAGGYGYYVKIQHDGTYSTLYGHCSVLLVSAGQQVKQGSL